MLGPARSCRRRRGPLRAALWALGGLTLAACGTAGTPRGAEAAVGAGPFPGGPLPPRQGLPLSSLDVPWTPATITAGDLDEVRAVLSDRAVAVMVAPPGWLGPRLSGEGLAEAVAALSPETHWLPPRAGTFAEATGAFPVRPEPGDPDDADPGMALDPRWTAHAGAGADALVLVGDAPLTEAAWRALPTRVVGGCDAVAAVLAAGQEHGLAEVEPFVAHVDALLLQVYRPAVAAMAPQWLQELAPYVEPRPETDGTDPDDPDARRHACGEAYLAHVRAVAACARAENPDCTIAPKIYLQGGLRVAVPALAPADETCPQRVGHDYVQATQQLAWEATQAIEGALSPRWLQLSDRTGALTEVHAALVQMCAPRRRRLDPDDLAVAHDRLVRLGDGLASDLGGSGAGRFVPGSGELFIPGIGAVVPVAAYDGGAGSVAADAVAQARSLASWLGARERCRGEPSARPWAVLTADPRTGAALSVTYAYPEEIACDGLGPAG